MAWSNKLANKQKIVHIHISGKVHNDNDDGVNLSHFSRQGSSTNWCCIGRQTIYTDLEMLNFASNEFWVNDLIVKAPIGVVNFIPLG